MTKTEWRQVVPILKRYHRAVEIVVCHGARVSPDVLRQLQRNMRNAWADVQPWIGKITADREKHRGAA